MPTVTADGRGAGGEEGEQGQEHEQQTLRAETTWKESVLSDHDKLALLTAGVQTGFLVPPRSEFLPKTIRDMTPKTQRRRAQDAWNAACRLKILIEVWARFL